MSKKALGRGLEALIPKKLLEEKKGPAQQIPLSKIKPNPFQPRKIFRPEDLQELVQSIKERGILQPIVVRKKRGSMGNHRGRKAVLGRPKARPSDGSRHRASSLGCGVPGNRPH